MSSTLCWRPHDTGWKDLSDELKYAIREKVRENVFFNRFDLNYFEGLRDAGVKDAQRIINAIEKHGEIEIKETY